MIELFLKIYEEFNTEVNKEKFTSIGLEPVKHIDMYRGQPLNPEQFEYYELPAMFIEYRVKWSREGKVYNGNVPLNFHLVTDPTWETSNISTSHLEGLKLLLFHAVCRSILDNLSADVTSKLRRVEEAPVDTGVVNYNLLAYECEYYDPMAMGAEYINGLIDKLQLAGLLVKSL